MSLPCAPSARSRSASASFELEEIGAQLELRFGLAAEGFERLDLLGCQRARHVVEDAQRAEGIALRRHERRAGVKADPVLGRDEGVVAERGVVTRVGDDIELALLNRVGAERDAARRFRDRDPDARLEPLAVGVDEADERDRRAADVRGEQRQVIERTLGIGVEDAIPLEGRQPSGFVVSHAGSRQVDHQRPVVKVRVHGRSGSPPIAVMPSSSSTLTVWERSKGFENLSSMPRVPTL